MPDDFDESQLTGKSSTAGYFLMLERGGCNFAKKIKHAMGMGATVLIITDFENP